MNIIGKQDLRFADAINWHRKITKPWDVARLSIRLCQLLKFGGLYCNDTHTVGYTGDGKIFEITFPKARFIELELKNSYVYTVARYADKAIESPHEISTIYEAWEKMEGDWYDVSQLLNIGVNQILGFPDTEYYNYCDISKKNKVCSSGYIVGLVKCWQKHWQGQYRRPLEGIHVEKVYPAHLLNHPTFNIVGRLM